MNIIVPINIEGLRVSPSTNEQAKTALYDFSTLGTNPASAMGDLIAANQFMTAETAMRTEPGIHLHWSLPKVYTHGKQDQETGLVSFPVMPNRWLIIRFLKDNKMPAGQNTSIRIWVLESDAHNADSTKVGNSNSTIPWMDDPTDIQGMQFNYVGNRIDLQSNWTEPSGSKSGFLGSSFQAPFGYGETFTAYYRNSSNVLGLYDDLKDHYPNANQLETNCDFSASYMVMGWLNNTSLDECNKVLNAALAQYNNLPDPKPDFASFIQDSIENNLKWSLSDYSSLTPANVGQCQALMSGMLSSVTWQIASPGNPYYPDALPSGNGVDVSIGNNVAEAVSAYINAIENTKANGLGDDVTSNIEMLLNALQFNQLQKLPSGDASIGQLEEFLHGTCFASGDGGSLWSVRQKMEPGQKPVQGADNEVTLPLYLAKILSELNEAQNGLDAVRTDIVSRRRQLFFDWDYHIKSINDNVIKGKGDLSSDITGAFLADGLIHLYPFMLNAGNYSDTATPASPYNPAPDPFSILAPVANLPSYQFNTTTNSIAGNFIQSVLTMIAGVGEIGETQLPDAQNSIALALALLVRYQQGGADAQSYLQQANAAVNEVLSDLNDITQVLNNLKTGTPGLPALLADATQAKSTLDGFLSTTTGVFATSLVFTSSQDVPVAPGTTYNGKIPFSTAKFLDSWGAPSGSFPGMKAQMDIFSGQNGNPKNLFETESAALYLGAAYFYHASGLTQSCVCAYYLQMARQELVNSQTSASAAIGQLQSASTAMSFAAISGFSNKLSQIITTIIPAILSDISSPTTDSIMDAIQKLTSLLDNDTTAVSVPALRQVILSEDWQSLQNGLDAAAKSVAGRLPYSQQVEQWNQFLYNQVKAVYQLDAAPADPFYSPNDPVLLFAEKDPGDGLLKPADRNGQAPKLPCRMDTEIIGTTQAVTVPAVINALATNIQPGIDNLSANLQKLGIEAFLLSPEYAPVVSAADLASAASQNKDSQYNKFNDVILNNPPTGLSGKLPYYIAFNWWAGSDNFLPLFIWWETEYQYSQNYNGTTEKYPGNYLSQFELGQYEVDLQPTAAAMSGFNRNTKSPNYFSTHGLISLSSSTTANLCDQIKIYCTTYLNYDPSLGPPPTDLPNYEQALRFYKAYSDFKTRTILSQGLSGFSESMVQRSQELQIPINIPKSWTSTSGSGIDMASLWPTTFIHSQSQDWNVEWNSEGINFDAFSNSSSKVFFSPLRAGFLQVKSVVLVDVFGRFVNITLPQPIINAESMTSEQPAPQDHNIYLAPRLVQPSRLNMDWLSATANGIGSFTELNSHPAASPICGWIFPNQLNVSLMLYDAGGMPLGSLGARGEDLHWFPVPGETTTPGANNRDQMIAYFNAKNANPVFTDFIEQFLYVDDSASSMARLDKFLSVISQAQQFIITAAMQENSDLAVLIGQPLVVTQATISLEQKGEPYVGLDLNTYPVWNKPGSQFTLTSQSFIPYNFGNFNQGNVSNISVPVKVGTAEIRAGGTPIPYFDDGLAGYFIGEDFSSLYTPVDTANENGIVSTAYPASSPVNLTPNGESVTLTMIMDPRAAVHATTGILPVGAISIPGDQFAQTSSQLQISFLATPVLAASNPPLIPLPSETGFQWFWQQIGKDDQGPLKTDQQSSSAVFPNTPQQLIDGWLKLKK